MVVSIFVVVVVAAAAAAAAAAVVVVVAGVGDGVVVVVVVVAVVVVVVVVVVVAVVGCHRFAPLLISDTVLDSWAFAPNTFYTHNLSKGTLSQNLSPCDLSPKRWASVKAVGLQDSPFQWWPAEHAEGG